MASAGVPDDDRRPTTDDSLSDPASVVVVVKRNWLYVLLLGSTEVAWAVLAGSTTVDPASSKPLLGGATPSSEPLLVVATEVSRPSSLVTSPLSFWLSAVVVVSRRSGVPAPRGFADLRAACPARVRAEARSSSRAVRAARRCQISFWRSSARMRVQTLSASIGEKRLEKMWRTKR